MIESSTTEELKQRFSDDSIFKAVCPKQRMNWDWSATRRLRARHIPAAWKIPKTSVVVK